jgi:hypothetical protein
MNFLKLIKFFKKCNYFNFLFSNYDIFGCIDPLLLLFILLVLKKFLSNYSILGIIKLFFKVVFYLNVWLSWLKLSVYKLEFIIANYEFVRNFIIYGMLERNINIKFKINVL